MKDLGFESKSLESRTLTYTHHLSTKMTFSLSFATPGWEKEREREPEIDCKKQGNIVYICVLIAVTHES